MHVSVVHELPPFDTGQYEGCEFHMHEGDASLHVHVAELGTLVVKFNRVRWHQFTALPNCSAEMASDGYFRLVETSSPEVAGVCCSGYRIGQSLLGTASLPHFP